MNSSPGPSKQDQEVTFSAKLQKANYNIVYFNRTSVRPVHHKKHFWMHVDTKLNFQEHLNNVLSKVNKTIGLLHKIHAFLPCQSLGMVC